ncbi:hypothetical protein Kpol_1013p13 [Vanderwaltozyma polyspora DSM 70294]|uniref:Anaphase-promoting complex subunit 5 n=1 Tax=Vanderwaltozyma polyspora (strain ATCC 22028 / DSM 70294 / BCRC 21397 / CBS 2163 / NBRC 10782 / NRRL Y-8283 / UCD 57-17) TaxID=436907 RepID=A7TH61_VANPO|nr:uncharacterized protein Kpol_1013p13 [Vanderwaltozyma polyspora DSM 70294]EDO18342.1 hypothetical protein Kpol_1013p13 [Vanderwaltozyma polyspora DSM 70294]
MHKGALIVTYSITPYDISILLLIYSYCYEDTKIPLEVLIKLINPTLPNQEFNPIIQENSYVQDIKKPILPFLDDICGYLISCDQRPLMLKLISMLKAVDALDIITQLLRKLEVECLIKNYHRKKEGIVVRCRKIVRSSVLGMYLQRCISRYRIGDFNDKEDLWDNIQKFIDQFDYESYVDNSNYNIIRYQFTFSTTNNYLEGHDDDIIAFMKEASKKLVSDENNAIMVSHEHFQALLNWEIYSISNLNIVTMKNIDILTSNVSLNDLTKFPSIHILRYLLALNNDSYQTALDSLHNYFDYMLTQNGDNYFHISLLGLGTFFSHFHNCEPAINAFKEATKVARENKDTTILHLIMIWILNFIEGHPEYASSFQVTISQIVRYLKSCSESESSSVFENAYKYEGLLQMTRNSRATQILESSFKYMVIALQSYRHQTEMNSFFKYFKKLWEYFGYESLSNVYSSLMTIELSDIDREIQTVSQSSNYDREGTHSLLAKLNSPKLTYQQLMGIKLIQVQYLNSFGDLQSSMEKISTILEDKYLESYWSSKFEKEKCNILLKSKVGIRFIPELMRIIDRTSKSQNPLQSAENLFLLVQILIQINKLDQAKKLIADNILPAFAYKHIRRQILETGIFS